MKTKNNEPDWNRHLSSIVLSAPHLTHAQLSWVLRRVAVQNLQILAKQSKTHWAARPILRFMMSLHLTLRNNEFQSAEKKKIVKMVCDMVPESSFILLQQYEESSLHQIGLQVRLLIATYGCYQIFNIFDF